ncbi:MAG: transcriptional regulator [Prolixibacteraceae bacterium]|jgi:transcription initiation factor TFIIIB Brf1 subunit/transcription initiation factor TFIIB|nr:transcriptional regulator [Prolixibacteraceae bacterium]
MEAKEAIIKAMEKSGKPMKGGEIAEASGVDKKEVDKLIKKLVAEGKIDSPIRCFYALVK